MPAKRQLGVLAPFVDLALVAPISSKAAAFLKRTAHRLQEESCGPKMAPENKTRTRDGPKCASSLVAGARYAQRCPVEFGVPMEAVIAA